MIQLTINPKQIENLFAEIDLKLVGIKSLISPTVTEEIAKAAFTVTGKRFVRAVDSFATSNPKRMHHVYEWKMVGRPSARLFVLERESILNGTLAINVGFLQSKVPVPIPSELLSPGNTGKSVTSRTIFRDKASVMEAGKPVSFTAKKIITFLGTNGQTFVQPGTVINILNPGGVQVKDSFQKFMLDWYQNNSESIMQSSGMYETMVNNVAIELNKNKAGAKEVRAAVKNVASMYSEDKVVIK
jgi:hypothetical protein